MNRRKRAVMETLATRAAEAAMRAGGRRRPSHRTGDERQHPDDDGDADDGGRDGGDGVDAMGSDVGTTTV